MRGAYFYHVDEDGQSVRIRLLSETQTKRTIQVRRLRDWVQILLFTLGFLAVMVIGGTIDAWGESQAESTSQTTNY
jgi:hypothetical protein